MRYVKVLADFREKVREIALEQKGLLSFTDVTLLCHSDTYLGLV